MKLKCTLINLAALIILFIGIILVSIVKPNRRGFWCSDESIRYPKQPETVGVGQLAFIVLVIPLIVILVSELIACKLDLNSSQSNWRRQLNINGQHQTSTPTNSSASPSWSVYLNSIITNWLFSLFLTVLLTGFMKTQVGRLRPVFYALCRPSVSCNDTQNQGIYLTDYVCDTKPSEETFIRTSFPSGHSSYSMCSMVFLIVYIGQRFMVTRATGIRYLVASFQTIFLIIALYVGLSRISDNIHHWSDVLAGAILGVFVPLVCTLCLGQLGDQWSVSEERKQMETNVDRPEQLQTFCQK